MDRLIRRVIRHRWAVMTIWLAVAVGGVIAAGDVFGRAEPGFGLSPNTESSRVELALTDRGGLGSDITAIITPLDERFDASELSDLAADLPPSRPLAEVTDGRLTVASDESAALLSLWLVDDADQDAVVNAVATVAERHGGTAQASGPDLFNAEFARLSESDLARGELIALPIVFLTVAVLLRRVAAGVIPFLCALLTIPAGMLILDIVARLGTLNAFGINVAVMIGLGLSIDYVVLLIIRLQEELRRGAVDAIETASIATARTALWSASVMTLALTGLFAFPDPLIRSIAWGAIAVVVMTATAAATLMPAIVSALSERLTPHRPVSRGRITEALARWAQDHAAAAVAATIALLCLLTALSGGLVLGGSSPQALPSSSDARAVSDSVERHIPELSGSRLVVLASGTDVDRSRLRSAVVAQPCVASAVPRDTRAPGPTVLDVQLESELSDVDQAGCVRAVRQAVGDAAMVGGSPAALVDFMDSLERRAPAVAAYVAVAVLLVLGLLTRSVVMGVKAVLIGALSLGATTGLIVTFLQPAPVGIGSIDAQAFLLVLVFAFGLSMDYEIFLIHRITEHHRAGKPTRQAVIDGLTSVGPAVGIAAFLMCVVFTGFGSGSVTTLRTIGLGLAIAIALDATIIRLVLLPAAMQLLGRANWWPGGDRAGGAHTVEAVRERLRLPKETHEGHQP